MNRLVHFLILIISFQVAAALPSREGITLKFHSKVTASLNQELTFDQLLDTSHFSREQRAELAQIKLGNTPVQGETRIIDRELVVELFRQNQILRRFTRLFNAQVVIPEKITVTGANMSLTSDALEKAAIGRWQKLCHQCEFSLRNLTLPAVPAHLTAADWTVSYFERLPRGSTSIPVQFIKGDIRQTLFASAQVDVIKAVWVAARNISPGETLTEADLKLEKRNITYASDGLVEINKVIGQKLKRAVGFGQIVWAGDLLKEKAIRRGDLVRVKVKDSSWEMSLMAIAQGDAEVGDKITLRNSETKKLMVGRVTETHEVILE